MGNRPARVRPPCEIPGRALSCLLLILPCLGRIIPCRTVPALASMGTSYRGACSSIRDEYVVLRRSSRRSYLTHLETERMAIKLLHRQSNQCNLDRLPPSWSCPPPPLGSNTSLTSAHPARAPGASTKTKFLHKVGYQLTTRLFPLPTVPAVVPTRRTSPSPIYFPSDVILVIYVTIVTVNLQFSSYVIKWIKFK